MQIIYERQGRESKIVNKVRRRCSTSISLDPALPSPLLLLKLTFGVSFVVMTAEMLGSCFSFLLEEIEEAFPFFPCLHAIFATRPNVTPICVTTPLGPNGCSTTWYQPPNNLTDPQLCASVPTHSDVHLTTPEIQETATSTRVFGNDAMSGANIAPSIPQPPATPAPGVENTPPRTRPPKPSSFGRDLIEKA
jgi:hypothetical protein